MGESIVPCFFGLMYICMQIKMLYISKYMPVVNHLV